MMKTWQKLAAAAALSAVIVFTGSTAQAQECQPGIWTAFEAHADQYNALWYYMGPAIQDISNAMSVLSDEATYGTLLSHARAAASSLPTGRVVITVPDGTVVLDTARPDGDPSNPQSNTYQHFLNKTINENHNSRIAFLAAQLYPCGIALESKLSTTTGQTESYIAVRLGSHLDSLGSFRMSIR